MISAWQEWRKFYRSISSIKKVQIDILLSTLKENKDTEYGKRYNFQSVSDYNDYKSKVPLTTYDDYDEYIEAIFDGQKDVLTKEAVYLFEPSSGSTAPSKLIPYTKRLKGEFIRGILPWIFDLFKFNPDLKNGAAYWSVSPVLEKNNQALGVIRIGFHKDSEYLGKIRSKLINSVIAVPNSVKKLTDITAFQYVTLLFLLNRADLRLVSIWNPTFLTLLLDNLPKWWDILLCDLEEGTISLPISIEDALISDLVSSLRPYPKRAQELSKISPIDVQKIWPDLQLISCWNEGHAKIYSKKLNTYYFPNAKMQGKGLIATEAFISFPLSGYEGSILSINSHFYEFLPLDSNETPDLNNPKRAHELKKGKCYTVVVTTGGGLYRYQLNDIIEVCGNLMTTPLIRFVGRSDNVSDWFGEKLNGQFVTKILKKLLRKWKIEPKFYMLAPEQHTDGFRYILYLEVEYEKLGNIVGKMEKDLHYDYCRRLNQILLSGICFTRKGSEKRYLLECEARGTRLGNIKPSALQKLSGWRSVLTRY